MKIKKALALVLATVMLLGVVCSFGVAAENGQTFKDVGAKKWFYEAVTYVNENGLMNGTSADKFEPMASMTRAMFVTVLGRLTGVDAENFTPDNFSDTKNNTWYSPYISWAQENSIVGGYEDGTFKPMKDVTREEMSAIIIRYIEFLGLNMPKDASAPAKFTDAGKIAKWARDYVEVMRTYGIVTGDANYRFTPKETLTRAQAATIIMRLHKVVLDLTYNEPYTPDYSVNDGAFLLLGAWDIYYAALGTNTDGIKVNNTGADKSEFVYDLVSGESTWHVMNITERGIDLNTYPVVRVGYVQDGGSFKVEFSENSTEFYSVSDSTGTKDGVSYIIADVTAADSYDKGTARRFMRYSIEGAASSSIVYTAFFKTAADAEAFDFSAYAAGLKDYKGPEFVYEADTDKSVADKYLADADAKIDAIINSESNLTPEYIEAMGGTCYYISSKNGDDKNDGLTPETAWKTPLATFRMLPTGVAVPKLKEGDGVFFERGSVFDASNELYHYAASGDAVLVGTAGCYYGAYGEGPKPIFANTVDYEGQTNWSRTEYPNIWRLDYDFGLPQSAIDSKSYSYHDVGNIVLTKKDGSEGWGIKITTAVEDDIGHEGRLGLGNKTVELGLVADGFGNVYDIPARETSSITDVLKNDLEFFHQFTDGMYTSDLYMYYEGDLNADFESIVVCNKGHICVSGNAAMFDNLEFVYGGSHGIQGGNLENIVIRNCVLGWIGGSLHGSTSTRFGNAIENWEACDGMHMIDNYIYQVYDAGVTTQGQGGPKDSDLMQNFIVQGNVITHTIMPIELFNYAYTAGGFENLKMTDNYILYTGYGFGTTRADRQMRTPLFTWMWCHRGWKNCDFTNNICVYSAYNGAFAGEAFSQGNTSNGLNVGNNVFVMNKITNGLAVFWGQAKFGYVPGIVDYSGYAVEKSARGAGYLANLGIGLGNEFYNVDVNVYPDELKGGYIDRNLVDKYIK